MREDAAQYWDAIGINRQLLLWAVATRRQLNRWERLVAAYVKSRIANAEPYADASVWEAQTEHHFCLIAVRHLLTAIELDGSRIPVEAALRAELIEGRDLPCGISIFLPGSSSQWPRWLGAESEARDTRSASAAVRSA